MAPEASDGGAAAAADSSAAAPTSNGVAEASVTVAVTDADAATDAEPGEVSPKRKRARRCDGGAASDAQPMEVDAAAKPAADGGGCRG